MFISFECCYFSFEGGGDNKEPSVGRGCSLFDEEKIPPSNSNLSLFGKLT